MLKAILRLVALNILLVPPMIFFPALCLLPFSLIAAAHPRDNFSGLAQAYFWFAPFSCSFWMLLSCHWSSVRQWQREGRDLGRMGSKWHAAHGGIFCTVAKATLYMFAGLLGSFAAEIAFLITFQYAPCEMFDRAARFRLWFVLFPFAAFAPVIVLWARRSYVS